MIIAVIAAAGSGNRMLKMNNMPKQYSDLGDMSVLRRSIDVFLEHPEIDNVIVAIRPDDVDLYEKVSKGVDIIPAVFGGELRQDSVYNALQAIDCFNPDKVLIHDSVRPFVNKQLISSVIEQLDCSSAVLPCIPVIDTIKKAEDKKVLCTIDRADLWRSQTPQGFRYSDLMFAYGKNHGRVFTDEAAMMESCGFDVMIVPGSDNNMKITHDDDYAYAQYLAARGSYGGEDFFAGSGWDFHAFERGKSDRKLILGGIVVPDHVALKGHSDADLVLHALTDAILGAIGGGDIGMHFSDKDPRWAGKDSETFVKHAYEMMLKAGGRLINVDITIICETPKLSPYRDKIRCNIARMLCIDESRVNLKGKTTEKMGFLGRKEGMAVHIVVNVAMPRK